MSTIDLSVIIVSWNTRELLLGCLRSLPWHESGLRMEAIVVDNASTDGTVQAVMSEFPQATIIRNDRNTGFAAGNNAGLRVAGGRFVALINSDVVVLPGCLEMLISQMDQNPEIGIMGPKILWPSGLLQDSCRRFPSLWNNFCQVTGLRLLFPRQAFFSGEHMMYFRHDRTLVVDYLVGCFLVARREMILDIGLMDERFFMYAEEIDWCKRAALGGWDVVFYPDAAAIHYGRASSSKDPTRFALEQQRSVLQYWQKHHRPAEVAVIRAMNLVQWSFRLLRYSLRYVSRRAQRHDIQPVIDTCRQAVRVAAFPHLLAHEAG